MFTTTFYSYKGGVGRTLALANVGCILAQNGKKVLLVDFDLEAPGLTTLEIFKRAQDKPGIIDYVNWYLQNDEAPAVGPYIHTTKIKTGKGRTAQSFEIDVMPAGGRGESYAGQYQAVDWMRLYDEQNGFFLIEELRESWKKRGYDYVLVDSRTGHTDVGGICTRQLPDLVVAIFFPNEQNLAGLTQIANSIRTQGARGRNIQTLFVASRVPRLDDEHGVLRGWLAKAQEKLGYSDDEILVVEHYDSLSLLNQSVFVLDRPKSGLACQYAQLTSMITQRNLEDAAGALQFVSKVSSGSFADATSASTVSGESADDELAKKLHEVSQIHGTDSVIQYELARAFYHRRSIVEALDATDLALINFPHTETGAIIKPTARAAIHRLRLRLFIEIGSEQEISSSAFELLNDSTATETMILDALLAVAMTESDAWTNVGQLPALRAASPPALGKIARKLFSSTSASQIAAPILEQALLSAEDWHPDQEDVVDLQLILIAGGRFELAIKLTHDSGIDWQEDLATAFNYAMAEWGLNREPNHQTFELVCPLFDKYNTGDFPNVLQCLALTLAVLGRRQDMRFAVRRSREALQRQQNRREFSCWTYNNVPPSEFEDHLDAIVAFGSTEGPAPVVLTKAWLSLVQ
jgi:MinD-like ATPase involved in chromosome partitioning or flagellar assembly